MPSPAPPPGVYVPAVLFFKENEDLDVEGIEKFHRYLITLQPTIDLKLYNLMYSD
jgi:hypothetical protein